MSLDGFGLTRLTSDSLDDFEPRWSPDGKRIAYIHAYVPGGYQPNVTVMDADGSNPTRLVSDEGDANPSWSPDGSRVSFERNLSLFPRNQLWIVNADGTSPALILDSLDVSGISWTPTNTFIGADFAGIVQFNPDGTGRTRVLNLTLGTVQDLYPRMSPDGTRIVFHWLGSSGSDSQIYVVNSDGTNLRKLTNSLGGKVYPVWSPDGTKIAFSRLQASGLAIWIMDSDGTNQAQVSLPPGDDYVGDWRK